jgi:hypothetical protein
MKTLAALAISLCVVTASAQEFHEVMTASGLPLTIGEAAGKLIAQRNAAHGSAMRPAPDIIVVDGAQDAFIIPISGNTPGNFGTYFKSDLTIANLRGADQYIAFGYFKQGVENTKSPVKVSLFRAGTFTTFSDFVGTVLKQDGLGALFVYASDANGNPDANGKIDGYSRIWTPQPGSATGEVSQNFDAVNPFDLAGNGFTYIMGLRQDARFRSNVGIVNFSPDSHTWTVSALGTGVSQTVGIPAYSVLQTSVPPNSSNSEGFLALSITTTTPVGWTAYATTNDNTTGDGWVSRAKRFVQ